MWLWLVALMMRCAAMAGTYAAFAHRQLLVWQGDKERASASRPLALGDKEEQKGGGVSPHPALG